MSGRRWVVKAAVPLLILGVAIGTLRAGAETSERTGPPSATAAKAKAQAGVSGKKKKDPTDTSAPKTADTSFECVS